MTPALIENLSRATAPVRIYAWLLRAYPPASRDRFGIGMRDAFREDLFAVRNQGRLALTTFLIRTYFETVAAGCGDRWVRRRRERHVHESSQPRGGRMRHAFTFDLRHAVRSLRATPVVTAVAILSLALGIGANTALFSIVNSLLIKTLPVASPDRLVMIDQDSLTNPIWERLRAERHRLFAGACAWSSEQFNLAAGGQTDPVDGLYASGDLFGVLGVPALVGRTFTSADDVRGGGPDGAVVVISHRFWLRRFDGSPSAIGARLLVERVPMTVIGVMPASFFGPEVGRVADVIVPIGDEPLIRGANSTLDNRLTWWLTVMARLRPDQTLAQATSAVRAVQPGIRTATMPNGRAAQLAGYLTTPWSIVPAATGDSDLRTRYAQPLTIVLLVVGAVLLIACANIANLLLARAAARRSELSLRLALGASRWRLARQLLAESALLSATGAAVGLAFAWWASRLLVHQLATPSSEVFLDLSLDWHVLAFTTAVAGATTLLFGLAPALGVLTTAPLGALRDQARGHVGERHRVTRGVLVVAQVALSLGLVVIAALFGRTLWALTSVSLGFDSHAIVTVRADTSPSDATQPQRLAVFERLRDAAAAAPGVASASASIITPVSGRGWNTLIESPGDATLARNDRLSWVNGVTPEWFSTYGMRVVLGRAFTSADRAGARPVVIVNQAFVRRFFNGRNPVGQEVRAGLSTLDAEPLDVVGVVSDAVYRSQRFGATPTLYAPLAQSALRGSEISLSVRGTNGISATFSRGIADAIARVEPNAALTFVAVDDQVRASLNRERLVAMLAGFFGGLSLLLAGLGLYGVTAYGVNRRRGEIGIRMALGATAPGVVRLVMTRLGWLMAVGLACGIVLSLWTAHFAGSLLFDVAPRDPTVLAAAAAALTAVCGLAGWLPARRAARIDPVQVLREG